LSPDDDGGFFVVIGLPGGDGSSEDHEAVAELFHVLATDEIEMIAFRRAVGVGCVTVRRLF
jgi:hypothetical protein